MKRRHALALLGSTVIAAPGRKLRALIIDGLNNHDWQAGTRGIRSALEEGPFEVEVTTWSREGWQPPDFRKFHVVVNNFNGGHKPDGVRWPREVETAFERYIRGGGGALMFHAANNAFLEWPEYNRMIGLGWRDKTFGPGLRVDDDGTTVVVPKGAGFDPGHGPRHAFEVRVVDRTHPITQGLPTRWMQPAEQLTHGQHGPAQSIHILTCAKSEITNWYEPMDWVCPYGKGRVYTTMLGHTWRNEANPNLDCPEFRTLLRRGAEWAATGKVRTGPRAG